MYYLKAFIKRLLYKIKFRNLSVKLMPGCHLSIKEVECEGMNVIHRGVTFHGKMGYGSYIGPESNINATIGKFCSIGSHVNIISGTHPSVNFVSTHPCFYSTKKQAGFTYMDKDIFKEEITVDSEGHVVEIGNDVWIGTNVLILPGIHIGDGSIIAAGSVVTQDVQPYTIVGGVPAKIIRKRFSEEQINYLLAIQWWNQPLDWIKNNAKYFSDIEIFIKRNKAFINI